MRRHGRSRTPARRSNPLPGSAAAALFAVAAGALPALAQPATPPGIDTVAAPATTGKTDEKVAAAAPSIRSALGPYGDSGGYRAFLAARGLTYDLTYIGDAFGNPVGGYRQGATYEGRLDVNLNADLQKLVGLQGLTAHAELFGVHGRGLTAGNTLDLFGVTGIETTPGAKLYEVARAVAAGRADRGRHRVRHQPDRGGVHRGELRLAGELRQRPAERRPRLPARRRRPAPQGRGHGPPEGAGRRLRRRPERHLPARRARHAAAPPDDAVRLRLPHRGPPFAIGEAQYSYDQGADPASLPGVVKFGTFHHFDRFDATDRPFAPGATYRGDDGVYGIIDQTVYRETANPHQGAAVFLRATYDPADRNLIDVYLDGGIAYNGLLPGRPDDTAGVDFAHGHVSRDVTRSDIVMGAAPLIRDFQTTFEATYQIAVAPGVTLQPDAQYIVHPGAHGVGLPGTGLPTHDAAVFGLRATVHY